MPNLAENISRIYMTPEHDLSGRVAIAGVLSAQKVNVATAEGIVRVRRDCVGLHPNQIIAEGHRQIENRRLFHEYDPPSKYNQRSW